MRKPERRKGMRCDGARAASLRRGLGFSQQDVADKAKVSKTTVERLERGVAVDYQTVHQVAAVLGVAFADLLQPAEREGAGPEVDFVPLAPLGSARELMELLLRCDAVLLDIEDRPRPDTLQSLLATLRCFERLLPGTGHTDWDTLGTWRASAVGRLEGLLVLEEMTGALAEAGMHLLAGEYVADMTPSEAQAAAEDFVDSMEFTGLSGSDFDPRKRVGLLRVVQAGRRQGKVKVDDMARERAPAPEPAAAAPDDWPF
ncbi:helix-turn-helix domain-containing protein [Falsiroseomonas sp. CW058]|uniref:helix-turn-helix domain-containing protein n=1 Tax=Falsiroseomonas sp. CW058 TaxID=3388664 RepID=UPI003D31D121